MASRVSGILREKEVGALEKQNEKKFLTQDDIDREFGFSAEDFTDAEAVELEGEPLTAEELKNLGAGAHIWVRAWGMDFAQKPPVEVTVVFAAVTDHVPDKGFVAVWGATDEHDWLHEEDYTETWWAYLSKPAPVVTDRLKGQK